MTAPVSSGLPCIDKATSPNLGRRNSTCGVLGFIYEFHLLHTLQQSKFVTFGVTVPKVAGTILLAGVLNRSSDFIVLLACRVDADRETRSVF